MLQFVKRSLLTICYILTFVNCSGQSNSKSFDLFVSNFTDFKFPVNPTEFIVDREARLQSKSILKQNFDEHLRAPNETFWEFKNFFEYRYGGKHKLTNYLILFYSRNFVPDDINLQRSEIVLSIFTLEGNMISSIPVAGGYGDTLTFSSIINNANDIVVNYIRYYKDKEDAFTKYYFINDKGMLMVREDK